MAYLLVGCQEGGVTVVDSERAAPRVRTGRDQSIAAAERRQGRSPPARVVVRRLGHLCQPASVSACRQHPSTPG